MDVLTAILTRRSERHLVEPAPDDEEFVSLLSAAADAPDHGLLRPWRWVLLRGADRLALGECFAEGAYAAGDADPHRVAAKALRAPLLATLVFQPRPGHRVPEWEQIAATCSMNHGLMLLLHARGYGSIWRTGALVESPSARRVLGLRSDERLLGWLYVGTPERGRVRPPRQPQDVSGKVTTLPAAAIPAPGPVAPAAATLAAGQVG